jgi:Ca-activated chloride channel family protein
MFERSEKIVKQVEGRRGGRIFVGLAIVTAVVIGSRGYSYSDQFRAVGPAIVPRASDPQTVARTVMPNGVTLSGKLSQTKFVRAEGGQVYLSVGVTVPEIPCKEAACTGLPTDTVVVLDHSGSMSADNRLPFAKRAIHDLIDRMQPHDRVAIVVFDSAAEVLSPLTNVTQDSKRTLQRVVQEILPGSGTNLSAGIELGRSALGRASQGRSQKIILLSDGEANEGIVDPQQLAKIAATAKGDSASVSTIGMGLGFNEQLMANLADWGGGSFSYLEHLEKLGVILDRNLQDARKLFASNTTLELALDSGITLVDAAGYPWERSGDRFKIQLGQLLSGADKRLIMTLDLPTDAVRNLTLGAVSLRYTNDGSEHTVGLPGETIQIAVVEPARRAEVLASVDQDLYRESWVTNSFGSLQQRIQKSLKSGDVKSARDSIAQYEKDLASAGGIASAPLMDAPAAAKIKELKSEIEDSESGSAQEKADKRNRLGKKYLSEGLANQRQTK